MDDLQKAIKRAAQLREESYDNEASGKADLETNLVDFNTFYTLSIKEAADQAAEECGFDKRGTTVIYLLLKYCWYDILDWAENKEKENG